MSHGLFRIGEVSRRTGVSVDVIRAWERRYGLLQPMRTDSNVRLYSSDDIARLRLMCHYIDRQIPASRAAELVCKAHSAALDRNPGIPPGDTRKALNVLQGSLEGYDGATAEQMLRRLAALFTPAVILRDVILPYLDDLGRRWETRQATVAQEHFASSFLEAWLLAQTHCWRRSGDRHAVLACLPGEFHVLGLIAFGVTLRDFGWNITFLGRDTPFHCAEDAAAATGADVIVLAATMPHVLAREADAVARLLEQRPAVLGGPAAAHVRLQVDPSRLLPHDILSAAQILSLHTADGAPSATPPSGGGDSGAVRELATSSSRRS